MQTLRHQVRHSSCTFSPPCGGAQEPRHFKAIHSPAQLVSRCMGTRSRAPSGYGMLFFFSRHGPTSTAPSPEAVVRRPCDQQTPCRCSQHNGDADSTATRASQKQPLIAELPLMSVLPSQCTLDMTVAIPGHGQCTGGSTVAHPPPRRSVFNCIPAQPG